jgi:hypothetical protein
MRPVHCGTGKFHIHSAQIVFSLRRLAFLFLFIVICSGCGGGGGGSSGPPLFPTADLSGTWSFYAVSAGGTNEGTVRGSIVLNSSGQITGGSYTHSNGTTATFTGGTFSISGAGVVTGSASLNAGGTSITLTLASGKMDISKTVFTGVGNTNFGEHDFIVCVKSGGTFIAADLSGTWYLYVASSGGTHEGVIRAIVNVNSLEQITGGSYTHSDGTTATYGSGSFSMDAAGSFTGSATMNDGSQDITVTLPAGSMDNSKTMLSCVDSTNLGELDFIFGIKSGGTFSVTDPAGTWHIYLVSSGGGNEGTAYGTVVVNSSGQVTSGTLTYSSGTVVTLTGGTLNLNGSGVITGSITTNAGVTITIISGKLDSSKTMASFVGSTNVGELDFVIAIKGS